MDKSFFLVLLHVLGGLSVIIQLFLPIFIKAVAHYDMNRRKFAFSVYLFGFIKIIGGYIATYNGGLAVHLSRKSAVLFPYSKMHSERKRFSFIKTFHLHSFILTTECGAEYLLPISFIHAISRTYFFVKGVKKEHIENNLWLTDGDVLKVSFEVMMWFNLYIVVKNMLLMIRRKVETWQKKLKKSTV